jgi:hypothetical protein
MEVCVGYARWDSGPILDPQTLVNSKSRFLVDILISRHIMGQCPGASGGTLDLYQTHRPPKVTSPIPQLISRYLDTSVGPCLSALMDPYKTPECSMPRFNVEISIPRWPH